MAQPGLKKVMNQLPPEQPGALQQFAQPEQPPMQPEPTVPDQAPAQVDMTPKMVGVANIPGRKAELTSGNKAVLGSMGAQKDIVASGAQAQTNAWDQAASEYQKAADVDAQMYANEQRAVDETQSQIQSRQAQLDNDIAELNKNTVTPKSFGQLWSEKSTGQKLMAGIGMALSGLGRNMTSLASARLGNAGAFSQYRNPITEFIDTTIDNDVKKQQARHDALTQRVQLGRQGITDASRAGADRLENTERLRVIAFEKTKKLVESYKAKMQSAEQKAAADNLIEELSQKQAMAYEKMMAEAQRRAAGSQRGVVQIGNQLVTMPLNSALKLQQQQQEMALKQGKMNLEEAELGLKQQQFQREAEDAAPTIPGLKRTGERAPKLSPKMADDLINKSASIQTQLRLLSEAEDLAKKGSAWSPEDRARGNQLQKDLSDARRIAKQMGVPQIYELEMLESLMPNPVGLNQFFTATKYKVMKQAARKEARDMLRPYGYTIEDAESRDVQPVAAPSNMSNYSFKK